MNAESLEFEFEFDRTLLGGFGGWTSVRTLWNRLQREEPLGVPLKAGVYAVVLPVASAPEFEADTSAGWYSGRDPRVERRELEQEWVSDTQVMYLGKTGKPGSKRNLAVRIEELVRFGHGEDEAHYGGKRLWYLKRREELRVGWRATEDTGNEEARLHGGFVDHHTKLPFANERQEIEKPESTSKFV